MRLLKNSSDGEWEHDGQVRVKTRSKYGGSMTDRYGLEVCWSGKGGSRTARYGCITSVPSHTIAMIFVQFFANTLCYNAI